MDAIPSQYLLYGAIGLAVFGIVLLALGFWYSRKEQTPMIQKALPQEGSYEQAQESDSGDEESSGHPQESEGELPGAEQQPEAAGLA